jgi:hypothetical protein
MRRPPSAALVIACLALFIALSGTAMAAVIITNNHQVAAHVIAGGKAPAGDNKNIIARSLGTSDLHAGAVTNSKIADFAVTTSKLGPGSVTSSTVATNSLTTSDLAGTDVSGAISFSIGANTCVNLNLGVGGAQVGQVVLLSFIGTTTIPTDLVLVPLRVTSAGSVAARACNLGGSSMSVSSLGVRVITFG